MYGKPGTDEGTYIIYIPWYPSRPRKQLHTAELNGTSISFFYRILWSCTPYVVYLGFGLERFHTTVTTYDLNKRFYTRMGMASYLTYLIDIRFMIQLCRFNSEFVWPS